MAIHHNSGERNGRRLDTDCCIVFEVKNGQMVSGREPAGVRRLQPCRARCELVWAHVHLLEERFVLLVQASYGGAYDDGLFWDDGAWVEAPVVEVLVRSIGGSEPIALCRRWVEIADAPMEGALPFHPDGFFIRLV